MSHKVQGNQRVMILSMEIAVPLKDYENGSASTHFSSLLTGEGVASADSCILDWRYTGEGRVVTSSQNPQEGEVFGVQGNEVRGIDPGKGIYILSITHEYGTDATVHATREDAVVCLHGFVAMWWESEMDSPDMPDDRNECIRAYFERDCCNESYEITGPVSLAGHDCSADTMGKAA